MIAWLWESSVVFGNESFVVLRIIVRASFTVRTYIATNWSCNKGAALVEHRPA